MQKAKSRLQHKQTTTPLYIVMATAGLIIGTTLSMHNVELLSPQGTTPSQYITQTPTITPEPVKTALVTAYSCGGLVTEAEIRMNCPSLFSGQPKTATGTTPLPYKTVACDKANSVSSFQPIALRGYRVEINKITGESLESNNMQNYHVIKVKYLGPTDHQGSRVRLTSERFPKNSIIISYDYNFNSAMDTAISWLKSNAYDVIGQGESQTVAGYVILGSDGNGFERLVK